MSRWQDVVTPLVCTIMMGCAYVHTATNAPGSIDVTTPPREIAKRCAERPRDPGEHVLAATYGALAGGGAVFASDEASESMFVSPEVSVQYGTNNISHSADGFPEGFPARTFGANLGWTGHMHDGDGRAGPLYLEAQYRDHRLLALAVGWAASVTDDRHGFQMTLTVGPFYGRFTHLFAPSEGHLYLGVILKGGSLFIWSR